jgi:hypothetical protein
MEDRYMSQHDVRCLKIKTLWYRGPVIQAVLCLLFKNIFYRMEEDDIKALSYE